MLLRTFERLVDLHRALGDQEQATEEQDQVASGYLLPEQHEQRFGQAHDPGQRQQQQDARAHRQQQSETPRIVTLLHRQAVGQDRDKDDVVDPQHDLERRQGNEGDPDLGVN